MKKCGFENCDSEVKARGICNKHYQQLKKSSKLTISDIYWTEVQKANAVRLREEGHTFKSIGEKIGRTKKGVFIKIQSMLDSGEYFDLLDGRKAN